MDGTIVSMTLGRFIFKFSVRPDEPGSLDEVFLGWFDPSSLATVSPLELVRRNQLLDTVRAAFVQETRATVSDFDGRNLSIQLHGGRRS